MTLPPLALYVHLPWCVQKCPYCDFNSHAMRDALPERIYRQSLLADLDQTLAESAGRAISSVFFGGGTPSLFSAQTIAAVLQAMRQQGRLTRTAEITLEANPGASDAGRFTGYREAGVNRLSIGAQSFDNAQLQALGRIHDSRQITAAFEAARRAGFDNINIDIMHGLPEQTLAAALDDLECAIALRPEHLSWYQLTLEPGTPFHHRPPPLPGEDQRWEIQQQGQRLLRQAGFRQYEVSAWARPYRRSRHNLNYWQFGDYLGIGAGAHGKLTDPQGRIQRRVKPKLPQRYMEDALATKVTALEDRAEIALEFLMNALRLNQGFSLRQFEQRTALPRAELLARLQPAIDRGLLSATTERVRPTATGRRFLDTILTELLPEA